MSLCSTSQAVDSRVRETKQRLQNTLVDLLVVVCWLVPHRRSRPYSVSDYNSVF